MQTQTPKDPHMAKKSHYLLKPPLEKLSPTISPQPYSPVSLSLAHSLAGGSGGSDFSDRFRNCCCCLDTDRGGIGATKGRLGPGTTTGRPSASTLSLLLLSGLYPSTVSIPSILRLSRSHCCCFCRRCCSSSHSTCSSICRCWSVICCGTCVPGATCPWFLPVL